MISKYITHEKNHCSFDEVTWCAALKELQKGKVYGASNMSKSILSTSSSSYFYLVELSYPSLSYQVL
jgi:hypothetical protein